MLSGYVPGPDIDSGWSVFVGKNFEMREGVSELEGRAFIRGDFKAAKYGYVIGRAGAGSGVFPPEDIPTLVVGGGIKGSGSINTPGFVPIQVASNIASTVSFIDRGTVITGGVDYSTADALIADLHAKSQYWGSLPDTEGGSVTSLWGGVYITADGANGNPKLWVFNLTFDVPSSYWGVQFSGFEDGDVIFLDSSTTVYYLAREIQAANFANLTVISNSLLVIREFPLFPSSCFLVALGGNYDLQLNAFLGAATVADLERLKIGKAYLSALGVTPEGFFSRHENHSYFLRRVLEIAEQSYLVLTSEKFGRSGLFGIGPLASLTGMIADAPPPDYVPAQLRR